MVSCTNTVSTAAPLLSSSVTHFCRTQLWDPALFCVQIYRFSSLPFHPQPPEFSKKPRPSGSRILRSACSVRAAAQRPQQNHTCCGFACFNVLKPMRTSASACAGHTRSRASGGFEAIITRRRAAASTKPHLLRFCVFQCSQTHAHQRIRVCRAHAQPRKRRV